MLDAPEKRVNQAIDREKLRVKSKPAARRSTTRGTKSVRLIPVLSLLEYAMQDRAAEYVADFVASLLPPLSSVAESRVAVVSDPEIRGGEPVVRGTRIPVYTLAELATQGVKDEILLADYPSLTADLLRQALLFADLHPRAGRPPRSRAPWDNSEPIARLDTGTRRVKSSARKSTRRGHGRTTR